MATAESCTGGGIGAALTSVAGSSAVYKGGVVSYANEIKAKLLNVDALLLEKEGAVSAPVAKAMADGVRIALSTDIGISATGLAGPDGDDYGNTVGTVYIGYSDSKHSFVEHFIFSGDREAVRQQAVNEALSIILQQCNKL